MLTAVLAALVLQAAPAPAPAAGPERLANPVWIKAPEFDLEPRSTRARRVTLPEGNVEVTCVSNLEGRLENCTISSEGTPPALGRAALSAARNARIQPHTVNGAPAPATIIFGMEYKRPDRQRE